MTPEQKAKLGPIGHPIDDGIAFTIVIDTDNLAEAARLSAEITLLLREKPTLWRRVAGVTLAEGDPRFQETLPPADPEAQPERAALEERLGKHLFDEANVGLWADAPHEDQESYRYQAARILDLVGLDTTSADRAFRQAAAE